jgi:transcription antitermination factor NusG
MQSPKATKEVLMAELVKSGYLEKSGNIKDVLIFGFTQDNLDIDGKDNSLLEGYILLKLDEDYLKPIVKIIESHHIGLFFGPGPNGLPYPVPEEQVREFKKRVRVKKSTVSVGQKVRVTDGVLSGFLGKVVKKKALMAYISVKLPNRTVHRWVAIPNLDVNIKE